MFEWSGVDGGDSMVVVVGLRFDSFSKTNNNGEPHSGERQQPCDNAQDRGIRGTKRPE